MDSGEGFHHEKQVKIHVPDIINFCKGTSLEKKFGDFLELEHPLRGGERVKTMGTYGDTRKGEVKVSMDIPKIQLSLIKTYFSATHSIFKMYSLSW